MATRAVPARSRRALMGCRLERRVGAARHRRHRLRRRRPRAAPAAPCDLLVAERQRRRLARGLRGVDRGDELALARQSAAGVDALQRVALEQDDDAAQLRLGALATDREDVVPAVGVERIGEQRRAEDVAHLGPGHARLDQRRLLAGDDVALDDLEPVRRDDAEEAVGRLQRLAAGRARGRCRQRGETACERRGEGTVHGIGDRRPPGRAPSSYDAADSTGCVSCARRRAAHGRQMDAMTHAEN